MDTGYTVVNKSTMRTTGPMLAVAAGSGQVVRSAVHAGADLLLALNAGVYRNQGMGSLPSMMPFGNANEQTATLLKDHILPVTGKVPVIAGVQPGDASHPTDRVFADEAQREPTAKEASRRCLCLQERDRVVCEAQARAGGGVERDLEREPAREALASVAAGHDLMREVDPDTGPLCALRDLGDQRRRQAGIPVEHHPEKITDRPRTTSLEDRVEQRHRLIGRALSGW